MAITSQHLTGRYAYILGPGGFPGKGDSPQATLVLTPPSHLETPTADTGVTPAHGPDGVGTLECQLEANGIVS